MLETLSIAHEMSMSHYTMNDLINELRREWFQVSTVKNSFRVLFLSSGVFQHVVSVFVNFIGELYTVYVI